MLKDRIREYEPLWGSWYFEEFLGKGSFGNVYKISKEELSYKYTSAVKIISIPTEDQYREAIANISADRKAMHAYFSDVVKNIVNEVNVLYKLRGNTNILNYEDHMVIEKENEFGWEILVRMELADSLPEYLSKSTFTREQVVRLGIDICSGLDACISEGIIHRDIKEENIFVTGKGVFKLGDFGIAKELSKSGRAASSKGTPLYMAPEVYKREKYDNTVDIYSLGMVMYKLLNNNRLPFMPPYPEEIKYVDNEEALIKRLSGEPIPLPQNAGDMVKGIILKACYYDPGMRYQIPKDMKRDLETALGEMNAEERNETVSAVRPKKAYTGTEFISPQSIENIEDTVLMDEMVSDRSDKAEVINPEKKQEIQSKMAQDKNLNTSGTEKVIERIIGTQIIAVAGIMNRVGTTHTAINIAQFLNGKGYCSALFEMHESQTFQSIRRAYKEVEDKELGFSLAGIDYYPYSQYTKMSDLMGRGYNYIILDMGIYEDCDKEEFRRANQRIIVSGAKDWEIMRLEEMLKVSGDPDTCAFYFTFADKDNFRIITSGMKENKCFLAPYNPQVFEVSEETAVTLQQMLQEVLPGSEKKKKKNRVYTIHRNPLSADKMRPSSKEQLYIDDDRFEIILPSNKKGRFTTLRYLIIVLTITGGATLLIFLIMLVLKGKPEFDFSLF